MIYINWFFILIPSYPKIPWYLLKAYVLVLSYMFIRHNWNCINIICQRLRKPPLPPTAKLPLTIQECMWPESYTWSPSILSENPLIHSFIIPSFDCYKRLLPLLPQLGVFIPQLPDDASCGKLAGCVTGLCEIYCTANKNAFASSLAIAITLVLALHPPSQAPRGLVKTNLMLTR